MDAPPTFGPLGLPVPPLLFAGPTLIGVLISWLLYGVFLAQAAHYSQNGASFDRSWIRGLVLVVGLVQGLHVCFIAKIGWHTLVLGFLNPLNLVIPASIAPATPVLNGFVTLCVQCYFAWKLYCLSQRNKFMLVYSTLIGLLSLTQAAFSALITQMGASITFDNAGLQKLRMPITVHLTISAIGDVLITVGMAAVLRHYRQNTVFIKTKSLLNKLIINTVENGLVTSVWAIGNLVVYIVRKDDLINLAFQYIIGNLYAIVFITTLNRRAPARTEGSSFPLSDAQGFSSNSVGRTNTSRLPAGRTGEFQVKALQPLDDDQSGKGAGTVLVSVSREVHKDSMQVGKGY
ncbi:hypothetical protein FA13DRAFT_1812761 [Coprinellus micaceus]|uniref:DUF6534 domain-containing protein n=1 Tax=Coprinellus micaceus TaxID=71717 RepID=A0A4Y7THK0_COPMI|nr:hypothetical protein FA13DRAFT_1812761 [Coprinellus micaceus]